MMYRNRRWEDGERGQIVHLAAPGGMAREYTRLMARSRYHPNSRDARHLWKRICRVVADASTRIDGLPRP